MMIVGYLFEGHLTVDPEPPQPDWLVQTYLPTAAATLFNGESSGVQTAAAVEDAANLFQELVDRIDNIVPVVTFFGPSVILELHFDERCYMDHESH